MTRSNADSRRLSVGLGAAALFLISLIAIFGGPLLSHMQVSGDPSVFNDDVPPQLYPFVRDEAAAADYVADYYLSAFHPPGFKLLYRVAAHVDGVRELSHWLPYLQLLLTMAAVGLAAFHFGGWPAAWISAALALSSGAYLGALAGGLPRSFAFPIVAGILLALVRGSVAGLAGLAVAGALFYPVAAVIAGLSLLLMLFVPGVSPEGEAARWGTAKRMAMTAIVAALCALAVWPMLRGGANYGRRLHTDDLLRFPEAGPGGRYRRLNRPPFAGVARVSLGALEEGIKSAGRPFAPSMRLWLDHDVTRRRMRLVLGALLLVSAAGWIRMSGGDTAARRLLILPVVAVVAYELSRLLFPYLFSPSRYVLYALPPLAYVALASGSGGLLVRRFQSPWAGWLGAIPGAAALVLLGGPGSADIGLHRLDGSTAGGYAAIRNLPEGALLAGWPSGVIDDAPWLTGRPALVTFETHQAFHEGYLLEMRRRTEAVIDAFYACEPGPLVRLRDEFGVTHFVVDLKLARQRSAQYFKPFDQKIREVREPCEGRELEVLRLGDGIAMYRDPTMSILDLRRLPASPQD